MQGGRGRNWETILEETVALKIPSNLKVTMLLKSPFSLVYNFIFKQ